MALKSSDLTIFVHADGFLVNTSIGGIADPTNPAVRTVKVERDRDCEPLVFFLKPESVGQKTISLDFRQFGVSLFTCSFTAEVVSEEAGIHKLTDGRLAGDRAGLAGARARRPCRLSLSCASSCRTTARPSRTSCTRR